MTEVGIKAREILGDPVEPFWSFDVCFFPLLPTFPPCFGFFVEAWTAGPVGPPAIICMRARCASFIPDDAGAAAGADVAAGAGDLGVA